MTEAFVASPLVHAVGLALLQFLWQGALVGTLTALLLAILRRATAETRYIVACLGMAVMFAMPVVTTVGYLRERSHGTTASATIAGPLTTATPASFAAGTDAASIQGSSRSARALEWIAPRLPIVVLVWCAGVLLLALDLLRGWIRVRQLRGTAVAFNAPEWIESVRLMAARLGITKGVRLLQSNLIEVPAVVGWLRPAIIVPVSALAGLSPAQLELILAHELAHVRRGDYLINVLQRVVETLLFYHPAVWWVSRQIRIEREHCCDDLAVSLNADRIAYADALASLEELRATAPSLAMGARGGDLLNRVRRLISPGPATGPSWPGGSAMIAVIAVAFIALSGDLSGMSRNEMSPLPVVERGVSLPPPASAVPATPDIVAAIGATPQQSQTPPPAQTRPPRDPQPPQHASVSGVVIDEGGGVIPGATVTVWSVATGDRRSIVTNSAGRYTISGLPADAYDVTVSLQGFKVSRNRILVSAGQETIANVRLRIGSLTETVTVTSRTMISGTGTPVNTPAPPPPPPTPSAQLPGRLVTAADYFDASKAYYQQGNLAEADRMAVRALELLRAIPENALVSNTTYDASGPIRVGGSIREPKKIKDVLPVYPEVAQTAQVQGYVIIDAIIGRDGYVRDAVVLKGVTLLNDAALDAVRQWRYSPTTLNNVPIEVAMSVTVIFTLK